MIKAIIIEDEHYAAVKLAMLLKKTGKPVEVAGFASSVDEAVKLIEKQSDITIGFFDIQLADGLSFSIFDRCAVNFPVIFTTAYENYAIRAFKHHSIDYLLKPIRQSDLNAALDKYEKLWKPIGNQLNKYAFAVENLNRYKTRFTVKVGEHIRMIDAGDIVCFYSFEKGTFILTSDNRNYLLDYSLEDITEKTDPQMFFRVNRAVIININHIVDIVSYSNSRMKIVMKLMPFDEIIVSRQRVKSFREWID